MTDATVRHRKVVVAGTDMFRNRIEAGERLGERLIERESGIDVVLGIPRGGLPVARPVADAFEVPLSVVVASKIGAPGNPELALGAVAADGSAWLNDELIGQLGVENAYVDRERDREANAASEKAARYREGSNESAESETSAESDERDDGEGRDNGRPRLAGKRVAVIDDGLATGATAIACLRQVREAGAAYVVFAVPVGSESALKRIEREADAAVCLSVPERFGAVGQFYRAFGQVPDEEALRYLDRDVDLS